MNPDVDFYFTKEKKWKAEIAHLRIMALDAGLSEVLKWGCPCYTVGNSNIVLIHVFKEYCALLFFKGSLFKDPKNLLIQQTENVQAARQMRFTQLTEIVKLESVIKSYIKQAIEVDKAGLKVPLKTTKEYKIPEEFAAKLHADEALKTAFEALTPGRQRGYLYFFGQAKLAKTREARIEKYLPHIMNGKGVEDV